MAKNAIVTVTGGTLNTTDYTVIFTVWMTDGTNTGSATNQSVVIPFGTSNANHLIRQAAADVVNAIPGWAGSPLLSSDVYVPFSNTAP